MISYLARSVSDLRLINQSIKCTECGKIFKNVDLANYHAEKSGHDQFEESTEEVSSMTTTPNLLCQTFSHAVLRSSR